MSSEQIGQLGLQTRESTQEFGLAIKTVEFMRCDRMYVPESEVS